jgi:predicted transcriptional regulator
MSIEDALEHPKRQKVYGYILVHPGATFREVVRETGYATGTTRHHLTILKRSNAIMEQKYLQTLRYFENHGRYTETWDTIALLREEPLALLHQWVMGNPMNNQKAILAAMAEVGWSRSTAQHRLSRLVDGGLVSMRPQGRMNMYEASSKVVR